MIAGHLKEHDLADHRATAVRKTGIYTTTDNDSLLELEGTFTLTLHTPTGSAHQMLSLVNISGTQTLTTVVGLPTLMLGESVDIYYNGTEWRAK